MATVTRLVTSVDIEDPDYDPRQMSVSARLEAMLADGRRLPLLDDRGWSLSLGSVGEISDGEDALDIWAMISVEDIEETARVVVGPDEPLDGCSHEDMETAHWTYLAGILSQEGVAVGAQELRWLPHHVVLSERLLARLGRRSR